ncbi:MAG: hypothetical protein KDA25_00495, partial [Phycisphaerales bacterium]|nr:hypothetical protein [Phycisphaerales bacterium]
MSIRCIVASLLLVIVGTVSRVHGAPPTEVVRYDGCQVVTLELDTPRDLRTMHAIGGDRWTHGLALGKADYLLTPDQLAAVEAAGIPYEVAIADVQALIDAERERLAQPPAGGIAGVDWFADFKDRDAVNAKMDELAAAYPDLASTFVVGTSLELREIRGLRITGPGADERPAVLFDACQHAREWIAVMVPMYIAETLLTQYGTDPEITDLVDRVEFFIVPIVNPDGYVYTWGPDRFWRKNRRSNGDGTFGVDLNRNWGYEWGGAGSSGDPGNDLYRGPAPFSEPESTAMKNFIEAHPNIVASNDFHAYGQLHLQPWGWTFDLPPDHDLLDFAGANLEAQSESLYGVDYVHGPCAATLYLADGNAFDWAYGERGILGFTTELRPSGAGGGGFAPPPAQIRPTCEENFLASLWLAKWATSGVQYLFPGGLPAIIDADAPTTITVGALPITSGPLDPAGGTLSYRIGGSGSYTEVAMSPNGDDTFTATLPGVPCDEIVEYFFAVTSFGGTTYRSPADAPDTVHAALAQQIDVAFDDDFESDLGWTVTDLPGLSDGSWTRGVPVGGGDRGDPPTDFDGSGQCFLTDNVDGNSDVDGGTTILTSPTMDASDPNAVLEYARWYSNTAGGAPMSDVFIVEASDDDGANWVTVETVGPDGPEVSGGWFVKSYVVADLPGLSNSSTFRVRFLADDADPGSVIEAGVDAVGIRSFGCPDTGIAG